MAQNSQGGTASVPSHFLLLGYSDENRDLPPMNTTNMAEMAILGGQLRRSAPTGSLLAKEAPQRSKQASRKILARFGAVSRGVKLLALMNFARLVWNKRLRKNDFVRGSRSCASVSR